MRNLRWIGVLSIILAASFGVPVATATPPEEATTPPPTDTTTPPAPPATPPAPPASPPPETPPPPVTTVTEAPPTGGSAEGVKGVTAEKVQETASATGETAAIETLPFTGAYLMLLVGIAACLIGAGIVIRRSDLEG